MTDDAAIPMDGVATAEEAAQERLKEIHRVAMKRWMASDEFERPDREIAAEDLKFAAGGAGQWPDGMAQLREKDGRPMLTINRLAASIKQVVNDARQNKPGIKIVPADVGEGADEKLAKAKADIYEGIVRQIESKSNAQHVYMPAYEMIVRGGFRGSWRVNTRYCDEDSFDQEIVLEPILSPFAVYRDPDSKQVDHSDDTYCFVCEDMSVAAYKAKFPDEGEDSWETNDVASLVQYGWKTIDTIRLAEYWWVDDSETVTLTAMEDGTVVEGDMPYVQYDNGIVVQAVAKRQAKRRTIMRCLMNGAKILEGPDVFPGKLIPIVSISGPRQWVGEQMLHWSLIREAKGPQQMYNFWQTSIAERIALSPKQPYIATAKQVAGHQDQWANANTSTESTLIYNADPQAPGAPQRQQPAFVNSAEMTQAAQAIDDIKAAMGIFDRSLGASSQEKSGRAILAVQAQGDNATFDFPDLLAAGIAYCGRVIVGLIPEVMKNRKAVRALAEDGSTKTHAVNDGTPETDLSDGKFDVQVVVGPSYATKRMEMAEKTVALAQALPQIGQVGADLIVRAQDMPGADELADRLRKTLPPGLAKPQDGEEPEQEAPKPPDPELLIKMRTAKADIELKEAQREKVDAEKEGVELANQQLAAQLSAQLAPDAVSLVQQIVRQTIADMLGDSREDVQGDTMPEDGQPPEIPPKMAQPMGIPIGPPEQENQQPEGMPPGM